MSSNERPRSSKRSNALSRLRQLHNKIEAENRKLMVRYDLDAFAFGSTSPHFDPPVAYLDPDTRFGGVDPRITHFSDTCRNMDDMSANSFFELHIFDKDYGFEIKESNSAMYRYRGVMGSGNTMVEFAHAQSFDTLAYVTSDNKAAYLFMEGCTLDELMLLGF